MKYDWIFFDADETLFHFDAFQGMKLMFSRFGVDFSEQDYSVYQEVNLPLWVDYQDGRITAAQLKHARFESWATKLETTTAELNSAFLTAMADICSLLPGAKELMESLKGKVNMGIITNGFTELQSIRLERTGMTDYFDHVIISEEVGVAKPDAEIFEHAHKLVGLPAKQRVLMVGDNPHSDILGGLDFGIETCWLNSQEKAAPAGINPHYQVKSLADLQTLLLA
ncbi:pyrimidine 5'-nucleotidase [Vibrio crassostreae]|uniref:5'-nucleotidase yjjG n=1 Tax=Vibrio crassostreae TaxID=246167 RepID=A0ABM9QZL4_9VIBR|nr:pyrimidine 5'-nucleotidase [Vibrio crassostreae]ROO53407.1 putative hydrolase of the HAD superfamily [Vibrio crassostreae]ROO55073.1 putative hydrolase of the HAD superfamily [Vibrio crassostreae]ROO69182.1 putative hydrolase of the HAD superfamily [Vibrio crassostreae]ROO70746.1 putative hydrolase of the HAD superfamily [Vibrio crassostreae]ROR63732.1 putative hydrolase of the HAD superfamily [Vibrio crassostreae]